MSMPPFQRDIVRSCVWSSRGKVLGFFVATLCAASSSVGGPFVLARAIPQVGVATWEHLVGYFVVFAAALGAVRVLQEVKLVLTNSIEQDVRDMTNKRTLRGLLAVSESVYREVNSGKVATLLAGLHQSNKMCVQTYLMVLIGGIAEIIVSLAVIGGFASWYVAVFVPIYGVVIVWITLRSNKVTAAVLRQASAATNEGANLLGNIISNIESIKVFRGQSWVAGLYGHYSESARSRWNVFYRTRLRYGVLQALTVFLQFTAIFGMLLWSRAGVEQFVLVGLVLLQLNRPFELIGTSLRDLALARGMAEPMAELLHDHTVTIDGDRSGRPMPTGSALTVSARALSYTYPGSSDPALRPLDVDFRPGPVNYVVGPSGAGKSTLMRIILGLLRDYDGSVTVGGVELADIDPDDFFAGVGYVPQHPMMMNLSIRDNIIMGRDFTDQQVLNVLAEVRLTAKLSELPDELDHLIGERGEKFSGGERQRLAIARALIARPKILLLDEASSALDAATEQAIFQTLASVSQETTIIAITHRENLINERDAVTRIGTRPPTHSMTLPIPSNAT